MFTEQASEVALLSIDLETGCTEPVIYDYSPLPLLIMSLILKKRILMTWTTMMVTSVASLLQTLADRTMNELSERNAAGEKTKMQ